MPMLPQAREGGSEGDTNAGHASHSTRPMGYSSLRKGHRSRRTNSNLSMALPPLGIQSYCFRSFRPVDDLARCVRDVGLEWVEVWPGHFPHHPREQADANIARLTNHGVRVSSFGIGRLGEDEALDRDALEFCRAHGLRSIGAGCAPEAVEHVDGLLREYGVRALGHNHGRQDTRLGTMAQIREYLASTPPSFGLCLDTAWLLDSGEDPVAALDLIGDRVYGAHLKDFVFDADGKPHDVVVGTGGLDLAAFLRRLDELGTCDFLSLEYEGEPEDPFEPIRACVRAVQAVWP